MRSDPPDADETAFLSDRAIALIAAALLAAVDDKPDSPDADGD